jgi:hypothetical protein
MFQTLIASSTVGSGGAASVTFSSIPQTYTDLVIVLSARHNTTGADNVIAQLNGTTTGYTFRYLGSDGTSVQNYTQASLGFSSGMPFGNIGGTSYTTSTFNNLMLLLPNYTGAQAKIGLGDGVFENNSTVAYMSLLASASTVTAAVTSIVVKPANYSFVEFTTAYLYGTLKGSGGATAA